MDITISATICLGSLDMIEAPPVRTYTMPSTKKMKPHHSGVNRYFTTGAVLNHIISQQTRLTTRPTHSHQGGRTRGRARGGALSLAVTGAKPNHVGNSKNATITLATTHARPK